MKRSTTLLVCLLLAVSACKRQPPTPTPTQVGGAVPAADLIAPLADASQPTEIIEDAGLIAQNNRAVGFMGMFKYQEAIDGFAALLEDHPNWLDVQVNLAIGVINRQLDGDEALGLQILQAVLAVDPEHQRALFTAGILLKRAGREGEAADRFRAVLDADADDSYAAYYLAQTLAPTDEEAAWPWMQRAIENDPYLTSAYYGAFGLLNRLGRQEEAQQYFATFQRLQNNPRATIVKSVYTKMGPKAEAIAVSLSDQHPVQAPDGPIFEPASPLLADGGQYVWNDEQSDRPISVTACDINGDGALDFFLANALRHGSGATNAIIFADGDSYRLDLDHPFCTISGIRAALWGDYDNDGLTDVYFCRRGPNQLWRQAGANIWESVTDSTQTAAGDLDTVDGAIVDADHDGDLDIFCINADGPNELLNNNRDGTFRAIAQEQGIAGDGRASEQVLFADLDLDRDADIVVINAQPPHEVYLNDRLWSYRPAEGPGVDAFVEASITRATIADTDNNGEFEVLVRLDDGSLKKLQRDDQFDFLVHPTQPRNSSDTLLAVADLDGDGLSEAVVRAGTTWSAVGTHELSQTDDTGELHGWTIAVPDAGAGPVIVGAPVGGEPLIWRAGPGRHRYMALELSGRTEEAKDMRSNASGIGAVIAARRASDWIIRHTFGGDAGPGQSLQPIAIGLGGQANLDFLSIDWSDGLFQSEVHGVPPMVDAPPRSLAAGSMERIEETQRQASSCPVLFAWDGERFRFISDLLGVGGMGYMVAPGEYAPPRPWENFMFPTGSIAPNNGRYLIKVGEPMEEACYLDSARLVVYDLPPKWNMTLDERMGIGGPEPTGEPVFYRALHLPERAINDRGEDVTGAVTTIDEQAADVGELDHRFIGRLAAEHVLTLSFRQPIDVSGAPPVLLIDGWIEYPYSQTMFAAWQAGATYHAPTVEARSAGGSWRPVLAEFGYPAGMPRQMSVPLNDLPVATTELRIRTNQEIYIDRIGVIAAEPCPEARRTVLEASVAQLQQSGFAYRTTGEQRQPHYDYNYREAVWDARWLRGFYTDFGDVVELIERTDDAPTIFGPGEEVHLEFVAPPPLELDGWTRIVVLEAAGWCKDLDLFTATSDTVEPIPARGEPSSEREMLLNRFNTRYEGGR